MTTYTENELLISLKNVGLKYGEKTILREINAEIKNVVRPGMNQGQVVALIGRSGMGKSQLFRILSGLNKPTTGNVYLDADQHLVNPGEVGIIPQNYILFNHRTVYDNLMIGLCQGMCIVCQAGSKPCSKRKLTKKDANDTIRKYAEQFELTEHLQKFPAQLSGGQKQRVSIIQQVLTDNKYILLDEPFSGLDMIMVDKVIELLLKISILNEYNTLIIVSHDIPSSLMIADEAWVLAKETGKDGATITYQHDLKKMGLAWQPEIRKMPEFQKLLAEVKTQI